MHRAIYVLALSVFAMNTTEVMISGLLPALTRDFAVSVSAVGLLISVYAIGMAVGGPLMTVAALRVLRRPALIGLMSIFILGQCLGALAPSYEVMLAARLITALAAGAFFGTGASVAVALVGDHAKGRALSVMFGGLMIAQVIGLPVATVVEQHLGWRASFWAVAVLAALCLVAAIVAVPEPGQRVRIDIASEVRAFANGRLWLAYATNALSIGAVFAVFSFLFPILTEESGFNAVMVPALFAVYGAATIVGNVIVGRLVDRHTDTILLAGQCGLLVVLLCFGFLLRYWTAALICLVVLGLVGLPLSAARGTRVIAVANARPLVSTVSTAMVNVGIVIGPALAGASIPVGGLVAPMWVGSALALLGLITVLPTWYRDRPDVETLASSQRPPRSGRRG